MSFALWKHFYLFKNTQCFCVPVPVAAGLLRLWVRIPPGAWMLVCCECCVLLGRVLCGELITRPEKSYRLWCVVVCDLLHAVNLRHWTDGFTSPPKEGVLRNFFTLKNPDGFRPCLNPRTQVLNPLNADLNPICHLLALLGAHHILHISGIRVKGSTLPLDHRSRFLCVTWWMNRKFSNHSVFFQLEQGSSKNDMYVTSLSDVYLSLVSTLF